MKKLVSLFLAVIMIFAILPVSAFATETPTAPDSIEVVPNEVAEANLPQDLKDALNSKFVTCGTSKPSKTYDLSSEGTYSFPVDSVLNTTIYSKYIFVGHNGTLYFSFNDHSNDGNGYTVKVYKKGLVTTTIATYNGADDDTLSFSLSVATDAKVYFAVIPKGTTHISGTLSGGEANK